MDEARRSYTCLQIYDFGVDAVYVNKIYPQAALSGYFEDWDRLQNDSLTLAQESFPGQRQFRLELLPDELQGLEALTKVGEQLYAGIDPATVFCREQAFQIEERAGTRVLTVRLPYAREEELWVEKDGGDLLLKIQNQARRFHLPELLGRRNLSGWTFEQGELSIRFDY